MPASSNNSELGTPNPELPSAPRRILLVDDEPGFREIVRYAAKPLRVEIIEAETAAEAEAKFAAQPFDLVILDLVLPDRRGETVLSRIRELKPAQPVCVLSGFVTAEIGRRIIQDEHTTFFGKPIGLDELTYILQREIAHAIP